MKLGSYKSREIYSGQRGLKWVVLAIALIIGGGSIWYTGQLVNEIKKREKRQVDLYAKALQFIANQQQSPDLLFTLEEIIQANTTIPVVLTNENGEPEYYRNLPEADAIDNLTARRAFLRDRIHGILEKREPIKVTLRDENNQVYGTKFIYYEDSMLLLQLQYYPYIQLSVIIVFVLVVFAVFNYSRLSEQNRVWVGMAKETAHQLGTPLSSLIGWLEYLKTSFPENSNITEIDKDIHRLEVITQRFSSIGSVPKLELHNVYEEISSSIAYLKNRLSNKVDLEVEVSPDRNVQALINPELFSWVMENLIKNAVDAMSGQGSIQVHGLKVGKKVWIDVKDNGKGIPKKKVRQVFKPGFTTKKRGWGLGLALVKRIVEIYHFGKIYVKRSEVGKGTTFRIILRNTQRQ